MRSKLLTQFERLDGEIITSEQHLRMTQEGPCCSQISQLRQNSK